MRRDARGGAVPALAAMRLERDGGRRARVTLAHDHDSSEMRASVMSSRTCVVRATRGEARGGGDANVTARSNRREDVTMTD